jgi:inosine-uridine nucleoside N-ribohydrolase
MNQSVPVVIDTDPGIDDALALLLAARWKKCDLRAATASYRNHTLETTARNATLLLARAPADVMVLQGADRPLRRALITAKETHGDSGLGDHALPPPPPVSPSPSALRDALRAAREPVTLITLGPLTNLAHALTLDAPFVKSRVTRHVAMGGSLEAAGNTGPHSEFNVWCDPEAAEIVFGADLGTEMVGLDVTRQLVIPAAAVHKLATHADADAQWLGRLLGFYVRFHAEVDGFQGAVIHDPLAVALALEPSWGEAKPVAVRMDLSDGPMRGRTALGSAQDGDPFVKVFRRFDLSRVHDLLLEHLFGRWLTRADFAA